MFKNLLDINTVLEQLFRELMNHAGKPVRQIRLIFGNLSRLETQPTLWGRAQAERWGALDNATHKLNETFCRPDKPALMTSAQLALRQIDHSHEKPKAKCPFVPQREMVKKLWGTDARSAGEQGDQGKRLGQADPPPSAQKLKWGSPSAAATAVPTAGV